MSSSLTLQGYHSNCCCNTNRPKSCKARGQLLKGAAELVAKQISVIGRGFPRKGSYVLQNHYRVSLASRTAWETKTLKVQGANIPLHYVLSKFPPFSSVWRITRTSSAGRTLYRHQVLPFCLASPPPPPYPSNMISHTVIKTKECTLPPLHMTQH